MRCFSVDYTLENGILPTALKLGLEEIQYGLGKKCFLQCTHRHTYRCKRIYLEYKSLKIVKAVIIYKSSDVEGEK